MPNIGELQHLFPTPEAVEELGDDAAEKLLQLSRNYAPVEIDLDEPEVLIAHFQLAKQAAEKFQQDGFASLTEEEQQALHAFVHLVTRPSLQTLKGRVRGIPDSWPLLEDSRSVVNELLKGVGRLDRVSGDVRHRVATGWFVAQNLVMTNNHVVSELCEINPHLHGNWRNMLNDVIDHFNDRWEDNSDSRPTWDPADTPTTSIANAAGRVRHADLHPILDMAVLRVEGVANSESLAIPLSKQGPAQADHKMYTIGYPALQVNQNLHPALAKFLFGTDESGMRKRVAPGELLKVNLCPVTHDATTLGGSSGSPLIDFETHTAVGLHFAGQYGVHNSAVPLWQHQDDSLFSNHGLTFV